MLRAFLTTEGLFGEGAALDTEDDENWLYLVDDDSRAAWQDMSVFAESAADANVRQRLEQALQGKGAFSRFRQALDEDDGLVAEWRLLSDDRRQGRAREELAKHGLRPG